MMYCIMFVREDLFQRQTHVVTRLALRNRAFGESAFSTVAEKQSHKGSSKANELT